MNWGGLVTGVVVGGLKTGYNVWQGSSKSKQYEDISAQERSRYIAMLRKQYALQKLANEFKEEAGKRKIQETQEQSASDIVDISRQQQEAYSSNILQSVGRGIDSDSPTVQMERLYIHSKYELSKEKIRRATASKTQDYSDMIVSGLPQEDLGVILQEANNLFDQKLQAQQIGFDNEFWGGLIEGGGGILLSLIKEYGGDVVSSFMK
jgi:hypothetical protein